MLTHSSEEERRSRTRRKPSTGHPPMENLALLYQGLLTGIVRVKARRQHITDGRVLPQENQSHTAGSGAIRGGGRL